MGNKRKSIILLSRLVQYAVILYQNFYSIYIRIIRKRQQNKVFCIGFSKTGTSSLDRALRILGYRNIHWLHAHIEPSIGWIDFIKKTPYNAFSDAPMYKPGFFKDLDKEFPNSKFIFTPRNSKSLARSWKNYFTYASWGHNSPDDETALIKLYNKHEKDVYTYFEKKPDKLLIMDIINGATWDTLCSFLHKEIPTVPFPHKRKAKYKKI